MNKMSNEQAEILKKEFLEEKRKAYEAEPDVYNLVKTKRLLWRILAVYWIIYSILGIISSMQLQLETHYVLVIGKTLFQIFWLYVFISPEGTWRINIMLYFSAIYTMMMNIKEYPQALQFLPQFFQLQPLAGVVFLMEILMPVLILGIAFYLTLPKSHRERAERVTAILKELSEEWKHKMENPDEGK